MEIKDVKKFLGMCVLYDGSEYTFERCTIQRHESEFIYRAVLRDRNQHSTVDVPLKDITFAGKD